MRQCFICGFDVDLPDIDNNAYVSICALCSGKIINLAQEIHKQKIVLPEGRAFNFPHPKLNDLFWSAAINQYMESLRIEISNQSCRVCNRSLNHMAQFAVSTDCICKFCKVLNEI